MTVLGLTDTSHMCDITFVVGESPAQKLFLANRELISGRSPEFNRLCSDVPINGKVDLPNVDPDDFELVLRHISGEEVVIESIQHAWNLLSTAKMFELPALQEECRTHIISHMDVHNVCSIYEEADYQEEGQVILDSFNYIVTNVKNIFLLKGFVGAHQTTIEAIVKQNCINIESEFQLFVMMLGWAKVECELKKLPSTPFYLREILNPLLPYVRFLRMSTYEFMAGPVSSGILSKEEIMNILLTLFGIDSPKLPAWCNGSKKPREPGSGFKELSCKNNCTCLGFEEKASKDATTVCVNKDKAIFIVGIGFRLALAHPSIVPWLSATIAIRTSEKLEAATHQKRNIHVFGEQITRFRFPVYVKRGEAFQVVIKVDDVSPPIHCCELKPSTEAEPVYIAQDEEKVHNCRENPVNITSCFSTVLYFSIT